MKDAEERCGAVFCPALSYSTGLLHQLVDVLTHDTPAGSVQSLIHTTNLFLRDMGYEEAVA